MQDREFTADPIDSADYYIESVIDDHVRDAMRAAQAIPVGNPGECDTCGSYSSRLVNGMCCPCIDKYELAEKRNGKMYC